MECKNDNKGGKMRIGIDLGGSHIGVGIVNENGLKFFSVNLICELLSK